YRTAIVHFDYRAGRLLNPSDILATRTDQEADLLWIDRRANQARRPLRDVFLRPRDSTQHSAQNLNAGLARLVERGPNDFRADPFDLQVELNAGDAVLRAGD